MIVTIAALFVIPLAIWGAMTVIQQGTVGVSMSVLPQDATVKINDKEYTNQTSIRLKPGTYTVTVSKEGFDSDTQELVVKEGEPATFISMPAPISADARRWVTNNQRAYLELEGKAGELATQRGRELIDEYPLTKWLPLQKAIYTIGYKQPEEAVIITIDATEGYREAALQEIRDLGFNPGDYTIEFTNYRNPFDE